MSTGPRGSRKLCHRSAGSTRTMRCSCCLTFQARKRRSPSPSPIPCMELVSLPGNSVSGVFISWEGVNNWVMVQTLLYFLEHASDSCTSHPTVLAWFLAQCLGATSLLHWTQRTMENTKTHPHTDIEITHGIKNARTASQLPRCTVEGHKI